MNTLRNGASIVLGYVLFAVASMMLVPQVMTREGPLVVILALAALAVIGFAVGLIVKTISGRNGQLSCYMVAALIALITLISLVRQSGGEPVWYKVGTLVLTAPMIVLIGTRKSREKSAD